MRSCRARRALVLAFGAAAVLTAATVPAGAAAATPLGALQAAAHGTWRGRFGTLQFRRDGTARFSIRECGFLPLTPGYVHVLTDCAPDTATGRVAVVPTGYQLTEADGHVASLTGYVDPGGALHLGYAAVGQLAPDRTGVIAYAPGIQLGVSPTGCVYAAQGAPPANIPCSFTRLGRRTVLEFPVPDAAVPGGTRVTGLVYIARSRLLVGPELVDQVYTR
ncbi:MAG TPA: hypothetical protein VGU73_01620 [Acidimicrobiia bacterium]|nr:hypothetical protein [Acidimicrobiia bacterium]